MNKFIFIDISKCVGCHDCEAACAAEHRGRSFISVISVNEKHAVPLTCRHCEKVPCAASCPCKAILKTNEGVVLIDAAKCNGCRLCVEFCPFNVLVWDAKRRVMTKCDMCPTRLKEGKKPACVEACPTQALIYDEWDPVMQNRKEEVAKAIIGKGELRMGYLLAADTTQELKWK